MRAPIVFLVLMFLRVVSRLFYRQQGLWVGDVPEERWPPYRLVAILNHTSLMECLFAGQVPARFLWRMANHATIPIASVTMERPIVGRLWSFVAANIVSISRERDHTWKQVVESVDDPDSMVIILPEGRMKRAGGLDKHGRPMTIRGGIADLVLGTPEGHMLLAYSQGLHHIQVPGQHRPRLFRPVRMRFEAFDIAAYRERLSEGLDLSEEKDQLRFRRRMMDDLTARRDRHCTSDLGGTDEPEAWSGIPRTGWI
ncbi:MAG: hypothetical protein MI919_38940 [Holophagales bacterium]|nr:hypothetical protein [Holophagales bacterium]